MNSWLTAAQMCDNAEEKGQRSSLKSDKYVV